MSEIHEATPVSQPFPHFERFLDSREAAALLQIHPKHFNGSPARRDTRYADRKLMALPRIRSRRVGTFAVKSGQLASVATVYLAASDCKVIAESSD